jgi:hypothetical protein
MASSYSLADKAHALDLLHEHNDVPYVSYLTGISERTLYTWRKHLKYAMAAQEETSQPKHWVRNHPEHQERLQQQREKALQQQQRQPNQMTAFGMTQEELEEALTPEYIPSPYTNLHADMLLHLQHLNFSLTDDPENAHRKALAFSRILSDTLKLESLVRIEKPQLSLIKYEYPDKTYHDIPYWSNAIHERASQAYDAVIAEAKRQYEEMQAVMNPETPTEESPLIPVESAMPDKEELRHQPSLEELLAMPFQPEDFIPRHTGIHKYLFGEDPYSNMRDSDPDDSS